MLEGSGRGEGNDLRSATVLLLLQMSVKEGKKSQRYAFWQ